jgi:hypothetical protein
MIQACKDTSEKTSRYRWGSDGRCGDGDGDGWSCVETGTEHEQGAKFVDRAQRGPRFLVLDSVVVVWIASVMQGGVGVGVGVASVSVSVSVVDEAVAVVID